MTQEKIAKRFGISRPAVTQQIVSFTENGITYIDILNREHLITVADELTSSFSERVVENSVLRKKV